MTLDLKSLAAQMGIELTAAQSATLLTLLDDLDEWNEKMNLTAIRVREQQITKHLLDSLSVQPFLLGASVLDVGTGAGFPGLPLALVNPERHFTLLDATAKKLRFVEHAAAHVGLRNVTTVHARAEAFKPKERFDIVVSRALGPVLGFIESSGHLCVGGGRLLAMKGRRPDQELESLPSGWKVVDVHRLRVPALDEERHLVEICRSHDKI